MPTEADSQGYAAVFLWLSLLYPRSVLSEGKRRFTHIICNGVKYLVVTCIVVYALCFIVSHYDFLWAYDLNNSHGSTVSI